MYYPLNIQVLSSEVKITSARDFAGGLNGRRSQTGVMPKVLVAAMDVVKDGGQTSCQELRVLSTGGEFVWYEDRQKL